MLSIDDFVEYTGPQAQKNNRLAQYREEIARLRQEGASYGRITNYLADRRGLAVSKEAVRKYCKRYIDAEAALPARTVDSRPERTKTKGGPQISEHSLVAQTPPSNAPQPRMQSQTRLRSPSVPAPHARSDSNVASETASLQPTARTPVSRIDAAETESLIPPGFFGPASQLNPPYDTSSKEHRAMLDAQEKDTHGEGGRQSRWPARG